MDYSGLEDFIKNQMNMTHIYQPIMIKTLLESGDGTATVDAIAREFLSEDKARLEYYKGRVKVWPHKTLKKHKVVDYKRAPRGDNGTYSLLLDKVTQEQRARLIELCDLKLHEFIDRDPQIAGLRGLDSRSVSGSLEFQVRAKCMGVCVACGASALDTPMDIDHIVPHSFGGKTELDNLQLLCFRCNRQKKNADDTDFMLYHKRRQFSRKKCVLCKPKDKRFENRLAYAAESDDGYVVAPHSHIGSFEEMIPAEIQLCFKLINMLRQGHDEFNIKFHSTDHCSIKLVPT